MGHSLSRCWICSHRREMMTQCKRTPAVGVPLTRYHLTRDRPSRQSQRVRGGCCDLFSLKTLICHFEKYLHTMMLKLTEHVGITIFLLYKQKTRWNSDIQNFYSEIWICWIFAYFPQKIAIFRSGMFLWRHNYVTPWPIVLILDTKINFIGGSVLENLGRGL